MGELIPVNLLWQKYEYLPFKSEQRERQKKHIFNTGLVEGKGGREFTFIPTKRMLDLESKIKEAYNTIRVIDTEDAMITEAFYSSAIEGARGDCNLARQLYQCKDAECKYPETKDMFLGCIDARHLSDSCCSTLSHSILRDLWEEITKYSCDNSNIRGELYRIGDVKVGQHIPITFWEVSSAMSNWIDFYNSDTLNNYTFIKACLLHCAFETTHPFCDGNGRLGRLLIMKFLKDNGYDNINAISISKHIMSTRYEYYMALDSIRNIYSDCTKCIEYLLEVLHFAVTEVQ